LIPVTQIAYWLLGLWAIATLAWMIQARRRRPDGNSVRNFAGPWLISIGAVALSGKIGKELALLVLAPKYCRGVDIEWISPCNWIALLGLLLAGVVAILYLYRLTSPPRRKPLSF